jgi:hypothetical protein
MGTWNYGPLTLEDKTVVEGVLLLSCDVCSLVRGMAVQSNSVVAEARSKKDDKQKN